MLNPGIMFTFTVAMVTKMAAEICWKKKSGQLGTFFETFDREINIEHKQIPIIYFNI